ncbi:hypothetical protein [Natronorubrum sulfidifaciens]|uniref:hypothetical protein n=1 Tax=Natronorubrum sulfidifaciens TaxID=388259 RepID=UPI0012673490|nr:hypothetical protein [Natronorubrum sulfidifaciens]
MARIRASVFASGTDERTERSQSTATVHLEADGKVAPIRTRARGLWNRLTELPSRYLDPIFRTP